MLLNILMLIAGLALTLFSANWLVEGSSSIAKRFNISDMVIGLTIVALGTSTPELAINIFSAIDGSTGLAIGNVLGSNIANIFLILGTAALIRPLTVSTNTTWKDIPFSLLAAVVLVFMANDLWLDPEAHGNFISRTDGMVLLCFFMIFLVYTFELAQFHPEPSEEVAVMKLSKSILLTVVGVAGLFLGGHFLVDGATAFAKIIGVSDRIIGLTIVAVGTSLPELTTSIVAAKKGKTDLAVGNVIGSNILNVFLILGITSAIHPLPFEVPTMNHDVGLVLLASFLLFLFAVIFSPGKISRREGFVFVLLYVVYIVSLIFVN